MSTDVINLAYAENRCQDPAYLKRGEIDDPLAMRHFFDAVTGKPFAGDASFITVADGHTVLNILCSLAQAFRVCFKKVPYIAIVGKHGNPCGAAIDWGHKEAALIKALLGNTVAVMGGELVTNFALDDDLGKKVMYADEKKIGRKNWGLDVLISPYFSEGTKELLGKKEKRRLLANPALEAAIMPVNYQPTKYLRGGDLLIQGPADFILTQESIVTWSNGKSLALTEFETLLIAWVVAWHASSNTVALAKDGMLIGLGCGQQDRIECARLCIDRAVRSGHDTRGSVFASDAFFPYANGQLPPAEEIIDFNPEKLGLALPEKGDDARTALRKVTAILQQFSKLDRREAAELLIDAGCIGGVVPKDGKNVDQAIELFRQADLSVAFIPPEFRGFSKH